MSPASQVWVPFNLPLWGLVEASHIHVDNHMNMIFHGFSGKIIGVAAYPGIYLYFLSIIFINYLFCFFLILVKDAFEFGAVGATLHIHGATKWFNRGSFSGFSQTFAEGDNPLPAIISIAFLCSSITLMFTVVIMIGFYDCYLKPNLMKKFKKLKTA